MNNTIEIELRYEVMDRYRIIQFLSQAQLLSTKRVVDVYLDTPERVLWRRGIFVRIRDGQRLDVKFNRECLLDARLPLLDYCEEHSFAWPLSAHDQQRVDELLMRLDLLAAPVSAAKEFVPINNLAPHYQVDKTRLSYQLQSFTVALDEVADVGSFLEIERMASSITELETVKQEMQLLLHGLPLEPICEGYCSLAVKAQDPAWYARGRFVVREAV